MSIGNLLDTHTFNYTWLKPGLTNCEDLATALLQCTHASSCEFKIKSIILIEIHDQLVSCMRLDLGSSLQDMTVLLIETVEELAVYTGFISIRSNNDHTLYLAQY